MPEKPYVDEIISSVVTAHERKSTASMEDLRERILHYWGGADGIIKELRDTYCRAKPGGRAKEQILGSVMRILISVTESNVDDISEMEPEDAAAELKTILKELDDSV